MKKKVIVACAGAVATSTIAAGEIVKLCKENGIEVEICQVRLSEIGSHLEGADLIVTTSRLTRDYGVPHVMGLAFLTGIGLDKVKESVLHYLK